MSTSGSWRTRKVLKRQEETIAKAHAAEHRQLHVRIGHDTQLQYAHELKLLTC